MTEAQFRAASDNATYPMYRQTTLPVAEQFLRAKDRTAVAVRDRIMLALGMNASLFERSDRCDGCGFLLKCDGRPAKRAKLWRAMHKEPERPSIAAIARACGLTTHAPVFAAVKPKRATAKTLAVIVDNKSAQSSEK